MAAGLVLAQLGAQLAVDTSAPVPSLALLYITDHYAQHAEDILDCLRDALPEVTDWSGTVGVGVACTNAEYFDEPALAVMLCDIPCDQYRVFSGVAPLMASHLGGALSGSAKPFVAHTALVQADASAPDVTDLISELADRTATGYLFGGLSASRGRNVQFAVSGSGNMQGQGRATGVFEGGISGVAFGDGVNLISRVTQGCLFMAAGAVSPLSSQGVRRVTAVDGNLVLALDGEPALGVLLHDLKVSLDRPREALEAVRATLVGVTDAKDLALAHTGNFGADTRVRHIIGLDPKREGVAIADVVELGSQLAFCQRNAAAAKADLIRICAEIREELAPPEGETEVQIRGDAGPNAVTTGEKTMLGAVYISCSGRGGPHFGGPSAELQIVRHALGDVPLVGFFAGGEIARHHLYGYTGVLTVFTSA